jgi:hypothetical protein
MGKKDIEASVMARPVRVSTATIQSKTGKKASWSACKADEQTMRSQGIFQAEEGTAGRGGGTSEWYQV